MDRLAKEGAKGIQIEQEMGHLEKRIIIKSNFRKSPKADDYHTLPREAKVMLIRLRTIGLTIICAKSLKWHPQRHVTASRVIKQQSTFSITDRSYAFSGEISGQMPPHYKQSFLRPDGAGEN